MFNLSGKSAVKRMYGKLIAAWIFMADTILFLYKQKTTIQTLALQPDV